LETTSGLFLSFSGMCRSKTSFTLAASPMAVASDRFANRPHR
jgi:hypothetical protein